MAGKSRPDLFDIDVELKKRWIARNRRSLFGKSTEQRNIAFHNFLTGRANKTYFEDLPDEVRGKRIELAENERNGFLRNMARVVTDATDFRKGSVAGMKTMNAHLMGDRYERRVLNPMTRKWQTVYGAKEGKNGQQVTEFTAWNPASAESVARIFNIPFQSAFQNLPPVTPQDVKEYRGDQKSLKETRDVIQRAERETWASKEIKKHTDVLSPKADKDPDQRNGSDT